jgi:type IV pilus assembly protein PilY1
MNFSIAASPTAIDVNGDGYVDRVYVGDVGGQLWKFDVSANATSSWTGKRLFNATPSQANPPAAGEFYPAQAIYGSAALAFDTDMSLWVFFGTGDRNHPNSTASNRFYGIKDTTNMTNGAALTESSLVDVTNTNGTATQGWFFQLGVNEKVLASASVFNKNVFFSTFTPTSTVTCTSGGGGAKLYAVQMTTGYAGINFSTGAALSTTSATVARSTAAGSGIAGMPMVVDSRDGNTSPNDRVSVVTPNSNEGLPDNLAPADPFLKQVRSWRERIQ